jgi:hypothetical protein
VKTNSGKQISKYNAVTHGILRRLLTDYEKGIYEDFATELQKMYPPRDFVDVILLERVIVNYIRLYRATRAEKEQIKQALEPRITEEENPFPDLIKVTVIQEGYFPKVSKERLEEIHRTILRYERTAERALFRAIHELERRKDSRKKKLNSVNDDLENKN